MSQTLLEMAKELVTELIRAHHLSPDEAQTTLLSTHAILQSLHRSEAPNSAAASPKAQGKAEPADWKHSITKHDITCLECGASFRQLSTRHLRVHNLDARAYRSKYGIPQAQPLSSRQATARRREVAQQIRPWEMAASKRAGNSRRAGRRTSS